MPKVTVSKLRLHEPPRAYIGIDPGASGGIAVIWSDGDGDEEIATASMTLHDLWGWIHSYVDGSTEAPIPHAIIEKVGGYIGGAHARGSHMFTFGASYGGLRAFLIAAGIPFEEITPQTWQKAFGLKKEKEETGTSWKNRLKSKAQQLFPRKKVTLATADAILLAEYCRRKHEGKL